MPLRKCMLLVVIAVAASSCMPKLASFEPIPAYGTGPALCESPGVCTFMIRSNPQFIYTTLLQGGVGGSVVIPGQVMPGTDFAMLQLVRRPGVFEHFASVTAKCENLEQWLGGLLLEEMDRIAQIQEVEGDYLTRDIRLSIDRAIVLESLTWRLLVGADGTFTDVYVTLTVHDPRLQTCLGTFAVWGRHRGEKNTINMDKALTHAFSNLISMHSFANTLEKPL